MHHRKRFAITEVTYSQRFVLRVEDSKNKKFETNVDTVEFKDPDFSKGDGNWYKGEVVKDMGKIKIVQKKGEK
ncbi:MAG: hypothetical protein LBL79_01585 [Prevotella sp.]|nr:hypothetical protein [Prevotella sp.]